MKREEDVGVEGVDGRIQAETTERRPKRESRW